MNTKEQKMQAFERLLGVLDDLREKCPWDRKQTNESLRINTIEEVYELCDALIKDEPQSIKKELGDVLLHILFYSKIADEKEQFDIADVCNTLCDKLIFRHPHIYGETVAETAKEVEQNWEQIKLKEKDGNKSILDGVPDALPAMIKAHRIQDKARNVGFDWDEKEQIWDKVDEELNELKAEIASMNQEKMEEEFGDLFFSIINAARLYNINPENALEKTNKKFTFRFNHLEKRSNELGKNIKEMSLDEMNSLWDEAKKMKHEKE
ncbi:MAG: nucleoside triphosphate pyrophosphohydrolase [Bacteroidales bacterium]